MVQRFLSKNRIRKGMIVLVVILALIGVVVIELNTNPQFGGKVSKGKNEIYQASQNYKDGIFVNQKSFESHMKFSFKDLREGIGELLSPKEETKPKNEIPVVHTDSTDIANFKDSTRLIWFGHSAFLLQSNNKNILIDPMFGKVPSPYSWLGSSRFNTTLPVSVEKLPQIDVVLISHDHYDHLDYNSILRLKDKVNMFYTPLGVGIHLEKWGIEKERIVELDWWDDVEHDGIILRCTPAQHFSGRKLNTSNSTLWCSWIIDSKGSNIYFSGDGGYGDHFKEIGERFGPFDFAMLECGQYNEKWPNIHMFPEQTALAGADIKADQIMPIHWGAFRLSQHAWSEPVERLLEAAAKLALPVTIPKIGEPIYIPKKNNKTADTWWRDH